MSDEWYSRPVLFVSDINTSVDFYVKQFGFEQNWRWEDDEGKPWIAQVSRPGIELILTAQWPDKAGKGLTYISVDMEVLNALRSELEGRGVDVKEGRWGTQLMVVRDPDGNTFWFNYPPLVGEKAEGTTKKF
jgi:catechol 2,3-dioxygenase-like lactoylglutathione lyase family enzyme